MTDAGLNDGVAPEGKPPVTLKGDVHELPLPLKLTVTVYVAVPPGAIVLLAGERPVTVTVLGFESVNVFCACDCEPVALR